MSKHLNTIRDEFEQAIKPSLEKLSNANASFVGDKMVAYVLETGKWLFTQPIDKISEDELLRVGGHLTGAYAYFGNLCANARADRDVFTEKRDNLIGKLTLQYLDDKYKVTEARSRAKAEVEGAGVDDDVAEKELIKNNWENLMNATDKMISFIQTTLSYRKSEKFRGSQLQN